ncbi:MAG: hypothetical protein JW874_14695 [Spirochaetales bacterium]|nr:hypothetical protein [Spirochaetales bacterium]
MNYKHHFLFAVLMIISISCQNLSRALDPNAPVNREWSVLPDPDAPDFVKSYWNDIADASLFAMPHRNWQKAGLPAGLEKQVWEAWAPGAVRRWHNISPGYANVIYDAKIDNGVITLVLDGAGLVQSRDGGRTWYPLSHHLTNMMGSAGYTSFDISPANPEIIAVAGMNLDYTLDGGRTWFPVMDKVLPSWDSGKIIQGRKTVKSFIKFAYGFVRFNADGTRIFAANGGFRHIFSDEDGLEASMADKLKQKTIYIGDSRVSGFRAVNLGEFAAVRFILPHFADPNLVYASFSDSSIYICRNAKAKNPVFSELTLPSWLDGLQAVYMDISPDEPDKLLLTMSEQGPEQGRPKSEIVLAKVSGDKLVCTKMNIRKNNEYLSFASARWNPHDSGQIFAGGKWDNNSFNVSTDGGKTFSKRSLPAAFFPKEHTTGYTAARTFVFDRKSNLSVIYSVTGAWLSNDGFQTAEELLMTHDGNFFGNKGVGFAECAMFVNIRNNHTYISTTDHGAWRSDGKDTSLWMKISDNPGVPESRDRLCGAMAVSEDESVIYLVSHTKGWSDLYNDHKLLISVDRGNAWNDVTEVLGLGPEVKEGIPLIYIDPHDSANQWVFCGSRLYFSTDGGASFTPSTKRKMQRTIAWDPFHRILYGGDYAKIWKSTDMGLTWKELGMQFSGMVYSLGVLENGDIVAGDDGRLLVIPFDKINSGKIEQSMIRMTVGETKAEAASGLRTFKPVICRGMDIVTFTEPGWNFSTCIRNAGPLISRDGGRTFRWIVGDLPCTDAPGGIDLRDDRLIIGNRGIYQLDLKQTGYE